jgi:hypothetical protein
MIVESFWAFDPKWNSENKYRYHIIQYKLDVALSALLAWWGGIATSVDPRGRMPHQMGNFHMWDTRVRLEKRRKEYEAYKTEQS